MNKIHIKSFVLIFLLLPSITYNESISITNSNKENKCIEKNGDVIHIDNYNIMYRV